MPPVDLQVLDDLLLTAAPDRQILHRLQKPNASGLGFGLYGVDPILDDTLRPWLTELQLGPGLSFDDPVKERIIPNMVREVARIVLEVQ